jgi:hypothetical protein
MHCVVCYISYSLIYTSICHYSVGLSHTIILITSTLLYERVCNREFTPVLGREVRSSHQVKTVDWYNHRLICARTCVIRFNVHYRYAISCRVNMDIVHSHMHLVP